MIIEAIETALTNIDPKYCELSKIDYPKLEMGKYLAEQKYLERPFAYEFYHQLRKLLDEGRFDFGSAVIQGEVDKRYQHLPGLGKIPDFILHAPHRTDNNLAVIEFNLASNYREQLEDDFKKLVEFKRQANYQYLVEVVIGNRNGLSAAWGTIGGLVSTEGEIITVIGYDVVERATERREIIYKPMEVDADSIVT